MSQNVPVPHKVKEKLIAYVSEQRRLGTVVEEMVFTLRESLGLDETWVLTDVNTGFVKQASSVPESENLEG